MLINMNLKLKDDPLYSFLGLGCSHNGAEEGTHWNEPLGQGAGSHPEPPVQWFLPNN